MDKEKIKQLIEKEQRKTDPVNLIIDKEDEILQKIDGLDVKAKELDSNPSPIGDFINDFVNHLTRGEKGDQGEQGEPGKDGKTPERGVDYFTPNDIELLSQDIAEKAKPVKGVDYADGKDGRDGKDGKDGKSIKGDKGDQGDVGKDGKDGKAISAKDVIDFLKKTKSLDISHLRNSEQLLSKLSKLGGSHGGGIVTIQSSGVQVTNKATILNFTGSGLSSVVNNEGTVTITIAGGGTGITRTITVTSANYAMGSTTSVDYVYLVAGAHTGTLPTAVSNTNRYTVKNNTGSFVTVNTTGGQTIDGGASLSILPSESRDFISDNSNWSII